MTLPTDYIDGDVLTAADVNAITTAVNAITSVGKVKKVATASFTSGASTSSTNDSDTGFSISYTPINASNTLIITGNFSGGLSGITAAGSQIGSWQIYDSTAAASITYRQIEALYDTTTSNGRVMQVPVSMIGVTTANSTSARTYKIRQAVATNDHQIDAIASANDLAYMTVIEVEI